MKEKTRLVGREHFMKCKNCDKWYGAEDDDYGPCSIKHARGDKKHITHGEHKCDEIYKDQPE